MNAVAILNPKAQSGGAAETWTKVRHLLPPGTEVFETERPGHASELTRSALRRGVKSILAIGGDGTINEVVNGFFEAGKPIAADAVLGVIPHGTGSDFRRSLNLPVDAESAAQLLRTAAPRLIDVMHVRYTTLEGMPGERYSINVTSFGMGGAVAARATRFSGWCGGRIAFVIATLQTTAQFSGSHIRLTLDGAQQPERIVTNVAAGNGQYHGGGMWVCPRASLDDGLLDVTVVEHVSLFETIRALPSLYNGRIYDHPKVEFFRAKELRAVSAGPVLIEIDGEPLGKTPVEISVIPRTLRVLAV